VAREEEKEESALVRRKVKRKRLRTNLTLAKNTRRMLRGLEDGYKSQSRVVDKAVRDLYMRRRSKR